MDRPLAFSLVIPAFEEAVRLPRFLDAATAYLACRYPGAHEILVVDDGSRDETAAVAARAGGPVRVIRQARNTGKGAAVRAGMLAARGALRLFADADGSTPITEERRLTDALAAGYDIAIGSRAAAGGIQTWVGEDVPDDGAPHWQVRRARYVCGRVFARLVNVAVGTRIADTQCGFKLFRADAAASLFADVVCDGWAFDVEVLALAERRGLRVVEVPVSWHETPGSKIRVLRDGARMLRALWEIRRRCAREATAAGAPSMPRRRSAT